MFWLQWVCPCGRGLCLAPGLKWRWRWRTTTMADVWISRKRWTCKYCNVTINDDVPSRRHHENGMRHKNNVARALRSLHQENDLKKRNELAAAQQLARIEKVRMDQYGLIQAAARSHRAYDRGTFQMAPASAVPPPLPKPPAPWKPKDKMAAYTTATSLGITPKDEKWRCLLYTSPSPRD